MFFRLRPATPDDYPRIVAITNSQQPEPITVDDMHRGDALRPKDDPYVRLVAVTADGELAGHGFSEGGTGHKPGQFMLKVRVDAPFQGQGIGRALYAELEQWSRGQGAASIESSVREDDPASQEFARRHGFVHEYHLFESTLDLKGWDPSPYADAIARPEAAGIRFTTLAAEGPDDEATLRKYYDVSWSFARDIPGVEGRSPFPFEQYLQWIRSNPRWNPAGVILAADGDRWVALSEVALLPSGGLYNAFTGTDRAYRGRGLALAVKVKALEWAAAQGAAYIRTNNHSVNAPMLAVNQKLGYSPLPGVYILRKDLPQ